MVAVVVAAVVVVAVVVAVAGTSPVDWAPAAALHTAVVAEGEAAECLAAAAETRTGHVELG